MSKEKGPLVTGLKPKPDSSSYQKDEIKGAFDEEKFASLLEELGSTHVNLVTRRANCPVHQGDSLDSLSYLEKDGTVLWTCHSGCGGEGGSPIDLVMKAKGVPFGEACTWLGEFIGLHPGQKARPVPRIQKPKDAISSALDASAIAARVKRLEAVWSAFPKTNEKAISYLRSRGIEPVPGIVKFSTGNSGDPEIDRLARDGYRIAVRVHRADGEFRSIQFRLDHELTETEKATEKAKVRFIEGGLDRAAFGLDGGVTKWKPDDAVLVCEGLTDYLAAYSAGWMEPGLRIIGFPGAGGASKIVSSIGLETLKGRTVLLALDVDPAGQEATAKAALALHDAGARPYLVTWDSSAGEKDLCLALQAGNSLSDLIKGAVPIEPVPPGSSAGEMKVPAAAVGESESVPYVPIVGEANLIWMSDVQPKAVSWLWPGWIPFGKLTILDGDPGLGKSTLWIEIAAAITSGKILPGAERMEPGNVLFMTAEDDLDDTIRPRLDAAGVDVSRFVALDSVKTETGDTLPLLKLYANAIQGAMKRTKARLLVVDPLMNYLGDHDSNKDQEVRQALQPIVALAGETGAAVLVVRHLNKSVSHGTSALYRGAGSIGIVGLARSAMLVSKPQAEETEEGEEGEGRDTDRRILAPVKTNLCRAPRSLSFDLIGRDGGSPSIKWVGTVSASADDLVSGRPGPKPKVSDEEIKVFLARMLESGPLESEVVITRAKELGIGRNRLFDLRKTLGYAAKKSGMDGPWFWSKP